MDKERDQLLGRYILLTFISSAWVSIEPAPYDILIAILMMISVIYSYLTFSRASSVPLTLLWLFLMTNLSSMYLMNHFFQGYKYFVITLYLILFWALIVGLLNTNENLLQYIKKGYLTGGLLSAGIGIFAYFMSLDLFLNFGRVQGLFKDPNVFGPFLVPVALLFLIHFLHYKKMSGIVYFMITSLGIFLSFSRAAWINYIIAIITFLVLWVVISQNQTAFLKKLGTIVFILFIGTISFITVLNIPSIGEMFELRASIQHYDEDRFSVQLNILELLREAPFGIGPGQYDYINNYSAHSLYVRTLGEYGVLGFIFFMFFLMATCVRSLATTIIKKDVTQLWVSACLIGLFVNSLVIDTLHWRHFWLLLAIPWIQERDDE